MSVRNDVTFCDACNIVIYGAEKKIENSAGVFHDECLRKRQRRDRIKELFIRNAAEHGLEIIPHHPHGR